MGNDLKPLNILHTYKTYYPDVYGGIPYAIEQLMLVEPGRLQHQVLVCSKDPYISKEIYSNVKRVKSYFNLFSLPIAPCYPFRLFQFLKKTDIVFMHAPFPIADLVFSTNIKKNIPLVVYWHSEIVSQKFLGLLIRPMIRRTLSRAHTIIVSNQKNITKGSLLEEFVSKIKEVPYPVELRRLCRQPEYETKIESIKKKYPRLILACGRLVKYKGFEYLIEAMAAVDAHAIIIGEGVERRSLEKKIKNEGLDDRIYLIGSIPVNDYLAYLYAADIFVLSSVTNAETFGIVQLEAMAVGLPIINTQLETAVPNIARHEIEAITVLPRDAIQLANAINLLLNNENKRKIMGENAKKRVEREYSFELFQRSITDLIREILVS